MKFCSMSIFCAGITSAKAAGTSREPENLKALTGQRQGRRAKSGAQDHLLLDSKFKARPDLQQNAKQGDRALRISSGNRRHERELAPLRNIPPSSPLLPPVPTTRTSSVIFLTGFTYTCKTLTRIYRNPTVLKEVF